MLRAPLALVLLLAACGGEAPEATPKPRVFEYASYVDARARDPFTGGHSIREVQPDTLDPAARGLRFPDTLVGHVFAPDGATVAFGGETTGKLFFADLARRRITRTLRVGRDDAIHPLLWRGNAMLVLACQATGKYGCVQKRLLVLDVRRGYAVRVRPYETETVYAVDRRHGRVVLLAPPDGGQVGRARLLVVDVRGRTREVTLENRIGSDFSGTWPHHVRAALVLDGRRGRALVLGLREPVAEIDLRTLRVRYRRVQGLFPRPGAVRAAAAFPWTGTVGPSSTRAVDAQLAGAADVLLASSERVVLRGYAAKAIHERRLLDTRVWRAARVPETYRSARVGELRLTGTRRWDENLRRFVGPVVTAYRADGQVAYRVWARARRPLEWFTFGGRLYVGAYAATNRVYDARTGRLIHFRRPTEVRPSFTWTPPRSEPKG